ncbi:NAD(P)/FAD-dependent oxidoreductase [Rhodopila sp.]|uniref:NAD(P)/FAD-dependent oxidoreductase n=1 Tax=Rhodopila sp. TaxID=2480087 RepID=UPI003D145102
MNTPVRSALVVGAGIAGLACADALAQAGVSVTLLDKGRRPGGRVATRRTDGVSFNHGAQYATARGSDFSTLLAELRTDGRAAPWAAASRDGRRIVFLPAMSALPAALAEQAAARGVTLLTARHAAFLHPAASGWVVRHLPAGDIRPGATSPSGGELSNGHDAVLIALPSGQAAALLATAPHPFAEAAARAVMAPCWAVMARFPVPVAGSDVLQPEASPIAWAAREGSRPEGPYPAARNNPPPGASAEPDAWTLHATASWSRTHLEDSAEHVCQELLAAFQALTGASAADLAQAHRWRHALVETALGLPSLWDPVARIGACGDWCLGGRVEAAYDSGRSLARSVLAAQ